MFLAATTLHTQSAECRKNTPINAGRGWNAGLCLTEEQVWCQAHPGRHADCATADCRAEEIRLSLWIRPHGMPDLTPPDPVGVYTGCSAPQFQAIYDHIREMNHDWRAWADRGLCAVCVPESDRRSAYLPVCDEVQARCHGLHYRPPDDSAIVSWDCGIAPLDYDAVKARSPSISGHISCPLPDPR